MKRNVLFALLATLPLTLVAQDAPKAEEKPKAEAKPKADAKPAMSEKEMMEIWQKMATPGDAHKKLEPFVGSFTAKVKMWMAPGAPPEESEGTSEAKWALGNRYVEQRFEGAFMKQPFSGIGFTGYDNYKKRYVGVWMDSMGTAMMTTTGTADAAGKKFTSSGKMDDPVQKKTTTMKEVMTLVDNDNHHFEMWGPGPDGKMFKTMEITYTRKK